MRTNQLSLLPIIRAIFTLLAVTGMVLLPTTNTTHAVPGDLDTNFGTAGIVVGWSGSLNDMAIQSDDKIILVGGANNAVPFSIKGVNNNDTVLFRYNEDGNLDTSFSEDGKVAVDFSGGDVANAVALQPDGKIVIAGNNRGSDVYVARFTSEVVPENGASGLLII